MQSTAGVGSVRPASPIHQQGGGAEAIGRTERPQVSAGGGGGAAVDTLSSLERTHASTPVAPHVLGSHDETRADAGALSEAEVVGGGGIASA